MESIHEQIEPKTVSAVAMRRRKRSESEETETNLYSDNLEIQRIQSVSANSPIPSSAAKPISAENVNKDLFGNELQTVDVEEGVVMDDIVHFMATPNGDTLASDVVNDDLVDDIENGRDAQLVGDIDMIDVETPTSLVEDDCDVDDLLAENGRQKTIS